MKANKTNGGPAFPTRPVRMLDGNLDRDSYPGMSLRDWFASQALVGLLSRSDPRPPQCKCTELDDDPGEHYADIAYRYADAMITERAKKGGGQ